MIRRPPRSTLFSLHDALPIFSNGASTPPLVPDDSATSQIAAFTNKRDRKSTRLNSSHVKISYAVFCLKKKKNKKKIKKKLTKKYVYDDKLTHKATIVLKTTTE